MTQILSDFGNWLLGNPDNCDWRTYAALGFYVGIGLLVGSTLLWHPMWRQNDK